MNVGSVLAVVVGRVHATVGRERSEIITMQIHIHQLLLESARLL